MKRLSSIGKITNTTFILPKIEWVKGDEVMINEFYEAVLVSYQAYCRVNENKPSIFICSPQLREELGQTVLGLQIEIDNTLFGYQDDAWYWL